MLMKSGAAQPISKKSKLRKWLKAQGPSLVFLAPFTILFFLFTILPILAAVGLSFTYFNMVDTPAFVGFDNYVRMLFDDDVFFIALKNTAIFAMITGPVSYILSFLTAWLINEFNVFDTDFLPAFSGGKRIFCMGLYLLRGQLRTAERCFDPTGDP